MLISSLWHHLVYEVEIIKEGRMDYQVWTKDEFEGWKKVDCVDLPAAQREILKALTSGKEPLLTVEVPYDFNVKIKEDKIGAATKSKAKPDTGARAESKGEVRSGDTPTVPELDKGSGDPGAGDRVPGK